jgi:colicin import membrane protein
MTSQKWIKGRFDDSFSLYRMILLSVILHTVVLSILFLSPSLPSPKWTFGPVYTVQLVNFSEILLNRKDISANSGEVSNRMTADRTIILKKQIGTVPSVPVKRTDVQKRDFSDIERAMEKIRQKVSSASPTSAFTQNQLGEAETGMRMNKYYAMIWARIKNQWVLPQSILPRENIEAVVNVKILRSGAVTELSFEKRSGNRYFDESAMKAIRKADPLPPLPEWVRDGNIEIGIRFHSSELR